MEKLIDRQLSLSLKQGFLNKNVVRIDRSAFRNNLLFVKNEMMPSGSKLCAVMKSDCYGHSIKELAPIAAEMGCVNYFGIVDNWEATMIRDVLNIDSKNFKIIRLRPATLDEIIEGTQWQIEEIIGSTELIDTLFSNSKYFDLINNSNRCELSCHIEINTGLGRNGINYNELPKILNKINSLNNENTQDYNKLYINIKGIMTQFAQSEHSSIDSQLHTKESQNIFDNCVFNNIDIIQTFI